MATFLVFRQLPGVTRDQYAAAQQAAMDVVVQSSAHGHAVRYLGGFFIPDKGEAICIFDGDSADDIATVNEHAGIPFTEVREAIEMQPRPGSSPLSSTPATDSRPTDTGRDSSSARSANAIQEPRQAPGDDIDGPHCP
jgi:uncharacterized protein DUF4242